MKIKSHYIAILVSLIVLLTVFSLWKIKPKTTEIQLNPVSFSNLPGWKKGDLRTSFAAFQTSCNVFLSMNPDKAVGSQFIHLKARDWLPACQAAMQPNGPHTRKQIKDFFETWFDVVEFYDGKPVQGLFTGYYMSSLKGSLTKTEKYNVPIYGVPDDLVSMQLNRFDPTLQSRKFVGRVDEKHQFIPYHTRAEIDNGALSGKAQVIAWVDSQVERLFLEIQGSGVIEFPDGSLLFVGYVAENGEPYRSVASVLIKQGVMTRDNASMQHISRYLKEHPEQVSSVLNQNKSFVFFGKSKKNEAYGSQGTTLTPGYSMAVDLKWVPMGTPVWLNTTRPELHTEKTHPFQRLMIAQDTGGAIRGAVRGDVYWGPGIKAVTIAGKMKNPGQYWMLLPKKHVNVHQ